MSDDPHDYINADEKIHPAAKILFGWVTHEKTGRFLFWGVGLLSALLIMADFVIDRHPHSEFESYLGFYALYGFLSFSFVVLMGWPLGRLLRRGENYYGDKDDGEDAK
jgi:hypothetical protein